MTAYVETGWTERIKDASLIRYVLPAETFVDLEDAGMHVTRGRVVPLSVERLDDLPRRLADRNVVLRHVVSLTPLRATWDSTLHVSGIRLRNAVGWPDGGAAI